MLETELEPQSVFTVSDLLGGLKRLLAERVGRVWVAGELVDVHLARSGHVYFSLADDAGRVRCALFRSAALSSSARRPLARDRCRPCIRSRVATGCV